MWLWRHIMLCRRLNPRVRVHTENEGTLYDGPRHRCWNKINRPAAAGGVMLVAIDKKF
jgi:hypothetical protein